MFCISNCPLEAYGFLATKINPQTGTDADKELEASVILALALKMSTSDARAECGDKLLIALLGLSNKEGDGDIKIRLLSDGTNGFQSTRAFVYDTVIVRRPQLPVQRCSSPPRCWWAQACGETQYPPSAPVGPH